MGDRKIKGENKIVNREIPVVSKPDEKRIDGPPRPRIREAVYGVSSIQRYRNNMLIEALPDYLAFNVQAILNGLEKRPEGFTGLASRRQRASWLKSVPGNLFFAEGRHFQLFEIIDLMIREGYVYRNPASPTDPGFLANAYRRQQAGERIVVKYDDDSWPEPMTAAVVGCSGTGKSYAVREILKLYPHVIRHRWPGIDQSGRRHETFDQIVYLIVECPPDGSVKTMCKNILEAIDRVTGLDYITLYRVRTCTEADLRRAVTQTLALHRVGLLVIDEMQNIVLSRKNHEELFNFLVTMANTVEVPLLNVATPKIASFLKENFRVARRFGTNGTYNWTRMLFNEEEWPSFFGKLKSIYVLKFQFDENEVAQSLYEHSQGVPAILVNLFVLAQMQAMVTKEETLNAKIIERTFNTFFTHVFPMVDAMRRGTREALEEFPDIEYTPEDFKTAGTTLGKQLDKSVDSQSEMEYLEATASQKLVRLAKNTDNPDLKGVSEAAMNASGKKE